MAESIIPNTISLADIYYKLGAVEAALQSHLKSEQEQMNVNASLHHQIEHLQEVLGALQTKVAYYSGGAAIAGSVGTMFLNKVMHIL